MMFKSWLNIPVRSQFSIRNIPFGIIETQFCGKRAAVAIGNHVLDLQAFSAGEGFRSLAPIQQHLQVFSEPTLNAFASLGRPIHKQVREYIQDVFSAETSHPEILKDNEELRRASMIDTTKTKVKMHLPMHIGDYTDYYAGKYHAQNVWTLFGGPANMLHPNYSHLPVGYHGRASSIVVSGTPITRPHGQLLLDPTAHPQKPVFGPCRRLDIELELGAFLCKGNEMGESIPIADADEHIFGYVLLNDWSARDIQQWEMVPLGPFNGKNFATTISPWIVLADALEPFRTAALPNETELLPYLKSPRQDGVFDLKLEVDLITPEDNVTTIAQTSAANLVWSFDQMLVHHAIGGCPMNTGDLLGSGTISGPHAGSHGSLLEMNQAGKAEVMLVGMEVRTFLKDGDTIALKGVAEAEDGLLVGFGECLGTIQPALSLKALA